MIRNLPNKFKQMTLLNMINGNYKGKYDYFYLPMDLKVSYFIVLIFVFRLNAILGMHLLTLPLPIIFLTFS